LKAVVVVKGDNFPRRLIFPLHLINQAAAVRRVFGPVANQCLPKHVEKGYKAGGISPLSFFAQILTCSRDFVATTYYLR
jgi:hypothetical protein